MSFIYNILYYFIIIQDRKNTQEDAVITSIDQSGFSVILPQYGMEGYILFSEEEKLENEKFYAAKKFEKDFIVVGKKKDNLKIISKWLKFSGANGL